MRIEYPIAIDNDYAIWRAFNNQYWPALYFIDARGRVRQHHFGEGEYERSEKAIQRLLTDAGRRGVRATASCRSTAAASRGGRLGQPEVARELPRIRADRRASRRQAVLKRDRRSRYAAPTGIGAQSMGARRRVDDGQTGDHLERGRRTESSTAFTRVTCISSWDRHDQGGRSPFRVTIDGQPPGAAHGLDLDEGGNGTVREQRLYQLVRQPQPIVDRTFTIDFLDAGVEVFAFTFG